MRNKCSLLCSAAFGVMLAVGISAQAQAKVKHHHHDDGGTLAAKVDSLTAAVSDLEGRLNDEAQAQQAAQADAAAAKADAAAARAETAELQGQVQEQIQTIPGQVSSAVAASAPKPGWWANTQVGGTVFMNLSDINQRPYPSAAASNITNKDENGFNFDIKRAYISIDHQFNSMFSANITTDFTYDNATTSVPAQTVTVPYSTATAALTGAVCNTGHTTCTLPVTGSGTLVTGDKVTQLYIKKAFFQAKLSDGLIFRLGSADLPWIPFDESIYGYRYVENTLIDRLKFGTSADWGVHVLGNIPLSPMVTLGYQISGVNGNGYKIPGTGTANRSEYMDVEGRVNLTIDKKFTVAVGGYEGKLGQAVQGIVTPNLAARFDALAAYVDPRFRVGFEYFWAHDDSTTAVTATTAPNNNQTAQGLSGFGSVNLTPQVALFGRYDWTQPREDLKTSYTDQYFNIGLSYEPVKVVDIALVWKHEWVSNDPSGTTFVTTNFSALPAVAPGNGTYDEVGVWTQLKW